MAKRVITTVLFEDDITGQEVPEDQIKSIKFAYDSVAYLIDLGPESAAKFDKAMAPYVQAARRVGGKQAPAATGGSRGGKKSKPQQIREWAREHGIEVAPSGRIPQEVREQFEAANAA